jgi:hypothetical protein
MPLPAWIGGVFKPVVNLIDELHTSQEEKSQIKIGLLGAQAELSMQVLDYETKLAEQQTRVIVAEAQGQSWLQRNWRPMLMCTLGFIVLNNYVLVPYASSFGLPVPMLDLPDGMFNLLVVGVGGYVVGRSGEKITQTIMRESRKADK